MCVCGGEVAPRRRRPPRLPRPSRLLGLARAPHSLAHFRVHSQPARSEVSYSPPLPLANVEAEFATTAVRCYRSEVRRYLQMWRGRVSSLNSRVGGGRRLAEPAGSPSPQAAGRSSRAGAGPGDDTRRGWRRASQSGFSGRCGFAAASQRGVGGHRPRLPEAPARSNRGLSESVPEAAGQSARRPRRSARAAATDGTVYRVKPVINGSRPAGATALGVPQAGGTRRGRAGDRRAASVCGVME